jgi:hypothetical protein
VISWNEWSENTYIEPGQKYGSQELTTLQTYLQRLTRNAAVPGTAVDSSEGNSGSSWTGARAAVTLAGATTVGTLGLGILSRRRSGQRRHRAIHSSRRRR